MYTFLYNELLFKWIFKGIVQRLGHNSTGYNSCGPNEWQCKKSGFCISINSLCDAYYEDCGDDDYGDYDQSDEENCGKIFLKKLTEYYLNNLKCVMTSNFS